MVSTQWVNLGFIFIILLSDLISCPSQKVSKFFLHDFHCTTISCLIFHYRLPYKKEIWLLVLSWFSSPPTSSNMRNCLCKDIFLEMRYRLLLSFIFVCLKKISDSVVILTLVAIAKVSKFLLLLFEYLCFLVLIFLLRDTIIFICISIMLIPTSSFSYYEVHAYLVIVF